MRLVAALGWGPDVGHGAEASPHITSVRSLGCDQPREPKWGIQSASKEGGGASEHHLVPGEVNSLPTELGQLPDAAHSQPLFSAEAPTSQASAGIRMKTRITRGTKAGRGC